VGFWQSPHYRQLLRRRLAVGPEPQKVDAAGQAAHVERPLAATRLLLVQDRPHLPPEHVAEAERHLLLLGQSGADRRLALDGVRVGAQKLYLVDGSLDGNRVAEGRTAVNQQTRKRRTRGLAEP
jgi:hypothetical protein